MNNSINIKSPAKLLLVIAGVFLLLLICGVLWRGQVVAKSCSSDTGLIKQYNQTVRRDGVTKLQQVAKRVQEKEFAKDSTCIYMLMIAQYGDMKTSAEQDTYQKLKHLESTGKKTSPLIDDGLNRPEIERIIQKQIDDKARGYYGEG